MKKNLAIILLLVTISYIFEVNPVYALEKPDDHTPMSVCIGDQYDFQLSNSRYAKEVKIGIEEWITHLKATESKNNKWVWDINVKIIPWYQYYDEDCVVSVEFFYKPDSIETISDVVGQFWTEQNGFSRIDIYYGDIGYDVTSWEDKKYEYTKYTPVYKGVMGSAQVANIARHEFGHFLGLEHNENPTSGNSPISNSIMNPIINTSPHVEQIRPIDVSSVKKLYVNGFNDPAWNSRGLKTAGESGIYPPAIAYVYDTVDKTCKFTICFIPKNIELASKGELRITTQYSDSAKKYVVKDQNHTIVFSDIVVEPKQYTSIHFQNDGVFTLIDNTFGEPTWNHENLQITVGGKLNTKPTNKIPIVENKQSGVPSWIKNNAKWWADGTISDKDFVTGIQFLTQEKIIKVDQVTKSPSNIPQDIPSWIKNNAKWWSEGAITEDDFLKGIQFLANNGIIQVN